ncbi:aspartate-semialdehyde dehydrogenase [Altererythrobacter sp. ZODW24]|uniref:aspartate-semialdehyde dehydrogenase n=1 Tax=Altererythrobacter sp. ZODW24 TaxID=2185142 RepID=UPI0013B45164|nr:aspartate-semialdehyde dehydrogenase [Altererythrobacter sp. ZODW24]
MQTWKALFSISTATLLITGCSAEPGTAPAGQTSMEAPYDQSSETAGNVRLFGEDIRTTGADGLRIPFGSTRELTETAVTAALGEPEDRQENAECGAGPMEFTAYPGGLTLNFQDENLVGWFLREPADKERVATAEGLSVGSTLTEASAVYSMDPLEDSTLGEEYATDEGIGFFTTGDDDAKQIDSLYAGTNCFFR